MHAQPRGLRAREGHAVRTGQGPEITLGGPQPHGLDEALRHLVEPLVEAEQIAAPADPEGLFPAPGTEAAAGLDLGRAGDELLTLGTRRVERVVRLVEPRAGGHQADAAGIGNVAVEGQFPAHLHQDDVEGREGQCQPDDIEQRRSLVAPQRGEEVMQGDFHGKGNLSGQSVLERFDGVGIRGAAALPPDRKQRHDGREEPGGKEDPR